MEVAFDLERGLLDLERALAEVGAWIEYTPPQSKGDDSAQAWVSVGGVTSENIERVAGILSTRYRMSHDGEMVSSEVMLEAIKRAAY